MLIKLLSILIIPALIVVGVIFAINTLLSVDDLRQCPEEPGKNSQLCEPADAIVAISGGDTAARTQTAIDLYQLGWAPKLILSGAAADKNSPSNAKVMQQQALAAGVPLAAITLDEFATTTDTNAADLSVIAKVEHLRRIILVTSPYHQRRASLEFQKALGSTVVVLNHPTPNDRNWPTDWWLRRDSWILAASELAKLAFVKVAAQ